MFILFASFYIKWAAGALFILGIIRRRFLSLVFLGAFFASAGTREECTLDEVN